jgi:hypothetical protein
MKIQVSRGAANRSQRQEAVEQAPITETGFAARITNKRKNGSPTTVSLFAPSFDFCGHPRPRLRMGFVPFRAPGQKTCARAEAQGRRPLSFRDFFA